MILPLLIEAGAIPLQSSGGFGAFDVAPERIAIAAKVQTLQVIGASLPLGAAVWTQPFDPADNRPFGFSFVDQLDADDTIASIERISLSSTAAALGLVIDESAGHSPVIDQDEPVRLQLWFAVTEGFQSASSFDLAGTQMRVAFKIKSTKGHTIERSGVLTVRQQ
jgi:hypothetical protein